MYSFDVRAFHFLNNIRSPDKTFHILKKHKKKKIYREEIYSIAFPIYR